MKKRELEEVKLRGVSAEYRIQRNGEEKGTEGWGSAGYFSCLVVSVCTELG